ncbi:2Fe-2S iron-sulfur cluster binding domain-containing protein [Kineococcus sp. R8]|uniref:PDR/VanB family oxidoreductase n=1 Tax=Kineococcus siccus TaxID=2696567 RepID=UPI0014132346|nr:2Fe-2S iron-sulfur cluster binding domain-containing protein [Kineococcus siccus]
MLDVPLALTLGAPLPAFSLPALLLALAARRRRRVRDLAAADAAAPGTGAGAAPAVAGVLVGRTEPASGVVSLRLAAADGSALPSWEPGAHVDLHLPSGRVRQYSLHGDAADRSGYEVSVLHDPAGRGGSAEVHALPVGARVGIGLPRNRFPLVDAPAYLFVAGGIGITALLPMIEAVAAAGAPWRLVHRGRARSGMAFADDLEARHPDRVRVLPGDTTPRPDLPALLRSVPAGGAVYCCGPPGLLDAVAAAMLTACPQGELHVERFAAPAPVHGRDTAFRVVLPRAGTVVDVPAGRSMLASLRGALPGTPASCETGVCGSCVMRVLAGRPDHRDDVLLGAERDRVDVVYPCVSRSHDPLLVLDA